MKKIVLSLICLFPILLGVNFYDNAIMVQLGIGLASFIAGLLIFIFQKNIKEFMVLSLIQFIGALAGYIVSGILFLINKSDDFESVLILGIIIFAGLIGFFIQFIIGCIISKQLKRNKIA